MAFQGRLGEISQEAQHGEQQTQDQTIARRDGREKPEMADPGDEWGYNQAPEKPFDGFIRA